MENRYEVFNTDELGDVFMAPKTKIIEVTELADIKDWCFSNKYDYAMTRQLNQWIL